MSEQDANDSRIVTRTTVKSFVLGTRLKTSEPLTVKLSLGECSLTKGERETLLQEGTLVLVKGSAASSSGKSEITYVIEDAGQHARVRTVETPMPREGVASAE